VVVQLHSCLVVDWQRLEYYFFKKFIFKSLLLNKTNFSIIIVNKVNNGLAKQNFSPLFEKISWKVNFGFECYGVRIGIRADSLRFKPILEKMLPSVGRVRNFEDSQEIVSLIAERGKSVNGLYFNNEPALKFEENQDISLENLSDKFLIILAISSLPAKLYLHAGAVTWKNAGIILPGESFSGKTTLVKEFIKAGADYVTDDLTVLTDTGFVLPFPRQLAIRTDVGRELRTADYFGAKTIVEKVKLKMIVFTEFEKNAVWQPQTFSPGKTVMKLMDNFYYKPAIRKVPDQIIKTLAEIAGGIKVYEGKRGDARSVIDWAAKNF
jgi:hypothetical protein